MKDSAKVMYDLFHAVTDPRTINFASGSPANETLPVDEVREIGPSFVVTLGNTPLRSWLGDMRACIGDMHGRPYDTYGGMILFPLYHPASIIYNHALKDTYKEDLRVLAGLIKDARR